MKKIALLILCLPWSAVAAEQPESLTLWAQTAKHFYSLNSADEKSFKAELKAYYTKIYSGAELKKWLDWIEQGNVESEYYSGFYEDLKDTISEAAEKTGANVYQVKTTQKSCYPLGYNPPVMDSLVETYRISNCKQAEIDGWYESIAAMDFLAEICLDIKGSVRLELEPKSQRIISEQRQIVSSKASLFSISDKPENTGKWCK